MDSLVRPIRSNLMDDYIAAVSEPPPPQDPIVIITAFTMAVFLIIGFASAAVGHFGG